MYIMYIIYTDFYTHTNMLYIYIYINLYIYINSIIVRKEAVWEGNVTKFRN